MTCELLHAFADGELDEAAADTFREHLADCARCQAELLAVMQLAALPLPRAAEAPRVAPVTPIAWHRQRRTRIVAAVTPLLAAATFAGLWLGRGPTGLVLEGPSRTLEARLAYADADRHRPYDTLRAGDAPKQPVPLEAMAKLEKRGDLHGVGAAYLLSGDLAQAEAFLARAGAGPDVETDRAVLALQRGALEEALLHLDRVIAAQPRHAQALWNRALVLRELGLPLGAVEAFAAVAALGEPGWSAEARARAAALPEQTAARRRSWQDAFTRGRAMVAGGDVLSPEIARAHPGLARLMLYDALRTAPDAARVRALAPLASTLDGLAGGQVLTELVRRLERADFAARAPLTRTYAELVAGATGPREPAAAAAYLARVRKARQPDLLLGTLLQLQIVRANLAEYQALAKASEDPWFAALAAHETAKAEIASGKLLAAVQRLETAIPVCDRARIDYRCGYLEQELGDLYTTLHQLPEARRHVERSRQRAARENDPGAEARALRLFAQIARFRGGHALAAAYLHEDLLRDPESCAVQRHVHAAVAALHLNDARPAEAARELAMAPECDQPITLLAAMVAVDLHHFPGHAGAAQGIAAKLAAARAAGGLSPGEVALATGIEGRALLVSDRAAGRTTLERVVATASELPRWDVDAQKARAYAYSALALDAAAAGEHAAALATLAAETGASSPDRCALGLAVEDGRLASIARGPDGRIVGRFEAGLTTAVPPPSSLVSQEQRTALASCDHVDVFARPPLHGTPGLLDATIAWSYRMGHPLATAGATATAPKRLVVADIEAPAHLGLPRLSTWAGPDEGVVPRTLLRGADATPSRVLAEMQDASEIELHAHGLVDLGRDDASFVVLSPETDERFALSAGDLRGTRLRGSPVVILAACRAAQVAPYLHEPWSLPLAFVSAGARAVLASPSPIGDADAGRFFDAVRARIRAGARASVALRDERASWLARNPQSWARDVLVFE